MVELTLRWEKYGLGQGLHNMMESQELVDVTILCQGELIQAHKSVLAACSQQFREIFKTVPDKNPVIVLKGVDSVHLKNLLRFMYLGEVTVAQDGLSDFITTADELGVSALSTKSKGKNEQKPPTDCLPELAPEPVHSFQARLNTKTSSVATPSLPNEENSKSPKQTPDMNCDDQVFKEEFDDDDDDDDGMIDDWGASALDDNSDDASAQDMYAPQLLEEFQVPDMKSVSMSTTDDPGPSTSQGESQWVFEPSSAVSLKTSAHQVKTSRPPDVPEQTLPTLKPSPTLQRPSAQEPPPSQQPQASTSKGVGADLKDSSLFRESPAINPGFNEPNIGNEFQNTFKCCHCSSIFTSLKLRVEHEQLIHKSPDFICELCRTTFKNIKSLGGHYNLSHTGPQAQIQHICKICNCNFRRKADLWRHERNSHGDLAIPHRCKFCFLILKNSRAFKKHVALKHKNFKLIML